MGGGCFIIRMGLAACTLLTVGCVTRPPNTDLFGRPIAQTQPASTPSPAAPAPTPSRPAANQASGRTTVHDGDPDNLLAGIQLRTPTPTPSWSATPVVVDAREVTGRTYVVQSGDTLRGIGNRTGAGSEAIARANDMAPPYTVRVGQRLTIPAGRYHEIRGGQTGIAIARAYGVNWADIINENGLEEPYMLRVGQRLRLPAGATPNRPMTPEERAGAFTLDIDDILTGSQVAGNASTAPVTPSPAIASGNVRFLWPLNGTVLQRFGPAGNGRVNDGIKIATPLGAPVRAAGAGRIVYAGSDSRLLGGLILIDHGGGWRSAYGHLAQVAVHQGDSVRAGSIIATAGESGQVQQPQLHFQLLQNRRPVDPLRYLPAH